MTEFPDHLLDQIRANRGYKMAAMYNTQSGPTEPMIYRIRVRGHLSDQWRDWFERMTIVQEEHGTTLISGLVADQAALHTLLRKVRDTGLVLLCISSLEPDQTDKENE